MVGLGWDVLAAEADIVTAFPFVAVYVRRDCNGCRWVDVIVRVLR